MIDVEALAFRAPDDLRGIPRINRELHKDQAVGIEEKENLVKPINNLCCLITPGGFEVTLF